MKYLMGFMQHVDAETTKIMGVCFNSGKVGTTDTFKIVADIQADGSITDVAVRPATDQTKCYAEKFGRVKAPLLPSHFQSAGFPIIIHASQTYKGAP